MSVTLSQRVQAEAVRARASWSLLDVLAAPLWLAGWLAFWTVVVVAAAGRWAWAAVRLGWLEARAQASRRGTGAGRWPVTARVRRGPG